MTNAPSFLSRSFTRRAASLIITATFAISVSAQQGYKKPPQDVLDILTAAVTPTASVSPARDTMLLATGLRYRVSTSAVLNRL